ncbi:hypothetical protein VL15_38420, partial [Burkholderia cepacia]
MTHPAAALEPIETASRDELQALQLERMKWSLRHAYDNVPHYRRTFDAAGVHPDDLKTLADLAKFPFSTKNDLRDNYPFGLFAVPREQVVLRREREFREIGERLQVVRMHARRIERAAIVRDVVVRVAQRPLHALELQRLQFIATGG